MKIGETVTLTFPYGSTFTGTLVERDGERWVELPGGTLLRAAVAGVAYAVTPAGERKVA